MRSNSWDPSIFKTGIQFEHVRVLFGIF